MTSRGSMFRRLSAAALLTAALLILLSFTEADLARFAGPVPFATVTLSGDGGKWVVINRKGERQGIGAYVYAGKFSEGLAAVCDGTAWGYVDTKGKIVIPCKFSRAGQFHDGFAPVQVGGSSLTGGEAHWDFHTRRWAVAPEDSGGWHYIGKSGAYAIDREFEFAWEFSEGKGGVLAWGERLALLPDGTLIDPRKEPGARRYADPDNEPYPIAGDNNLHGFKRNDEWVIDPQFQDAERFSEGMAAVEENDRWGFIDLSGIVRIETDFEEVLPFSEGLAAVRAHGKWVYLRKDGSRLNDVEYDDATSFEDGNAVAAVKGKYGILGPDGRFLVPPLWDYLYFDRYQPVAWVKMGGKYGLIRMDGTVICEPEFFDHEDFHERFAAVRKDDGWNLIDTNGALQYDKGVERVYRIAYDIVFSGNKQGFFDPVTGAKSAIIYDSIDKRDDGFFDVTRNGKHCILSPRDAREVGPEFDEIRPSVGGLTAYRADGLWGFADEAWNVAVRPEYLEVRDFCNGLAPVKAPSGWGYVDVTGKVVLDPTYLDITSWSGDGTLAKLEGKDRVALVDAFGAFVSGELERIGDFSEGLAPARLAGKWGFIDYRGRVQIPMKFGQAGMFGCGLAPVFLGLKWGYVNRDGELAVPAQYVSAEPFSEGLGVVEKSGKWFFLDVTGSVVLGPYDRPVLGFRDGHAWIQPRKDEWVPIDRNGVADDSQRVSYLSTEEARQRQAEGQLPPRGNSLAGVTYSCLLPVSEGLRGFACWDKMKGIRDIEGRILSRPQYMRLEAPSDDLMLAEAGGRKVFLHLDGSLAIEPTDGITFESSFSEGLAVVRSEKGMSFINVEGKLAFDKWFEQADVFSAGLAPVRENGLWGFVNHLGDSAILARFRYARPFSAGLAVVETPDGYTAIDKAGVEQFPPIQSSLEDYAGDYACVRDSGLYRFLNRNGEILRTELTDLDSPDAPAANLGDGIRLSYLYLYGEIALAHPDGEAGDMVINVRTGRMRKIANCSLPSDSLADGRIAVETSFQFKSAGVLDTDLNWIVPPEYDELDSFSEGLAWASHGDRQGYIDVNGKWVIDLANGAGTDFRHGVALVFTEKGRMWINRQGRKATFADATCEAGRYEIYSGGQAGFLDPEGRIVIYPEYDDIRSFLSGYAAAKQELWGWGFIDRTGAWAILPRFDDVGDFSEGLAAVLVGDKQNGLWTFVDRKGNQIHEPYFDEVRAFHQGLAAVRRGAKWGYMDKHGWMVFPLQFDAAGDFMLGDEK